MSDLVVHIEPIAVRSQAPLPCGRLKSFSVRASGGRAATLRSVGIGGVAQIGGEMDGRPIRPQPMRIAAIKVSDGGILVTFEDAEAESEGGRA